MGEANCASLMMGTKINRKKKRKKHLPKTENGAAI
jgi:hypothetical protein